LYSRLPADWSLPGRRGKMPLKEAVETEAQLFQAGSRKLTTRPTDWLRRQLTWLLEKAVGLF
jgi:hypothetical protein